MRMKEIMESLGIPLAPPGHHHSHGNWINCDCPYCSPGAEKFRMGIHVSGMLSNCWVCGPHKIIETLHKCSTRPIAEIRGVLGTLTKDFSVESIPRASKVKLPTRLVPLRAIHRNYLSKRGFDPDELVRIWGIKGTGMASTLPWRILIPLVLNGKIVSWTTRAVTDGVSVPYISASPLEETINHKHLLFGEDYCRHVIAVNEGPLDAMAIGPGAVATLGVGYTLEQLVRISKYPTRVIIFDNEPEAQRRAKALCNDLSMFDGETFNVALESGKDASRASKSELKQLRKRFLL